MTNDRAHNAGRTNFSGYKELRVKRLIMTLIFATTTTYAAPNSYRTNCCEVTNAPKWLTNFKLSDIAAKMERDMGWSIRRVKVIFHDTDASFSGAANLNFSANAFFSPARQTIEFKPQKDLETFTPTFRHELSHVISNQKFKGAIPSWLEEGFANYLGSKRKVDYKWLAAQELPDASRLSHPQSDATGSQMHYQLSTATVEMIAKRCNLKDLLMLTTGSKLTNYLETFCKIKDINAEVRAWVKSKA
jgi:hypothetical protein